MQRGSGLAHWDRFAQELQPVLLSFKREHGRIPGRRTLARLGHQRLVSAAYRYYGGYSAALRRLGLQSSPPVRPARRLPTRRGYQPTVKRPRWRYWTREDVQQQTLMAHYAEWTTLGIFPPSTLVMRHHPGLATHWLRQPGGWTAATWRFGLISACEGRPQIIRYRAVLRTLECLERHGRWPYAREDKAAHHGRRRASWETFVTQTCFTPELCVLLWRRLLQHRETVARSRPVLLPNANRYLSTFIRSFHARYPFHRLD